jgi:hypothetical protein
MNTNHKKKTIEQKHQRRKSLPKQESKQPVLSGDMWESLHDGMRNYEHERPEVRLTR